MKKQEILNKVVQNPVIAVIRGASKEEALQGAEAVIAGGLKGIELTFTVPQADQVIAEMAAKYANDPEVVIGAGTVLDAVTARIAIMAGAQFIVSPAFDAVTAEICNLHHIPYMSGCMTINEMITATKAGVDIIKLFPGDAFGPSMVKSVKGPLPHINIMPTGGVGLDNMETWFKAGVIAVGIGGNLMAPAEKGDFAKVTEIAKQYVDKMNIIKGKEYK
ncbi:bifunctional 4-hydroxy-2-oxoglutarate aldolase/2-dehydro-3-deoxy-phosphogluconate aldolase [Bacillus cytotoxicus]|uniref:bifunctional 4-hydroxy-2-oxoglutarate aldolase/2-dehydro-3-deoxy-phosphogluconate aldolase n=1 Tax=Bacillus cytotoxicus TaxID=580165 RepID=UPI0035CB1452